MTKRSASELISGSLQDEAVEAKRPKLQDTAAALSLIESYADDLIECLQALKNHRNSSQDSRLSALSHTLLPAFEVLGGNRDWKDHPEPDGSKQVEGVRSRKDQKVSDDPTILTKWNVKDIPSSYPLLPKILDPALEKVALTHPGTTNANLDLSYERLEWIGDAYLYLIASGFIYQTFTSLSPGRSSQLREQLVRNSTLGEYTRQYGLDKRASLPAEFYNASQGAHRASEKERKKALGDLFEAYVGAVIHSDPANGVARASSWLKELWSITIADQLREESRKPQPKTQGLLLPSLGPSADATKIETTIVSKGPEIAPKVTLAGEIACGKVAVIEYGDMDSGKQKKDKRTNLPLFTVGCYFTGWGEKKKLLGIGTDLNKKEAGQKAAKKALENKKLIQAFADKKLRFLAERETAGGKQEIDKQHI